MDNVESAVEDARVNAALNGIGNAEFVAGAWRARVACGWHPCGEGWAVHAGIDAGGLGEGLRAGSSPCLACSKQRPAALTHPLVHGRLPLPPLHL